MNNEVLSMKNIVKSYQDGSNNRVILSNLNLTVREGEFIAVVGPSGVGKSTFLSIAGGLLSPESGSVSIRNQNISTKTQKELTNIRRNEIGFIFQNHQLLPYLTVREQLNLVAKMGGKTEEVDELLSDLGLLECQKRYPGKLSGGEKQRTAIAETVGCEAKTMDRQVSERVDVLFLGASVYWAGIDGAVKEFIQKLDASKVEKVVIFSTSALAERVKPEIEKLLTKKGIKVDERDFYCRGEFMLFHKGKPDKRDIAEAKKFARRMMEE